MLLRGDESYIAIVGEPAVTYTTNAIAYLGRVVIVKHHILLVQYQVADGPRLKSVALFLQRSQLEVGPGLRTSRSRQYSHTDIVVVATYRELVCGRSVGHPSVSLYCRVVGCLLR